MSINHYQYAFIGVMFCIVCIWVTMFIGKSESIIEVSVPTDLEVICSCEHSPMLLKIDASGQIIHDGTVVSEEAVLNTLKILRDRGWTYSVYVTAPPDLEHSLVADLTLKINERFKDLNIVWLSSEA